MGTVGNNPHQPGNWQVTSCQPAGRCHQTFAWEWLTPIFGAFLQSADDQQVHLVDTFFDQLIFADSRWTWMNPLKWTDTSQMPLLLTYGNILGEKIINDHYDRAMGIVAPKIKK
jgi:hypothetical protein